MNKRESSYNSVQWLSETEAMTRYGLGRNTTRDLGKAVGAVVRIGRRVLYNKEILDAYFESLLKAESSIR